MSYGLEKSRLSPIDSLALRISEGFVVVFIQGLLALKFLSQPHTFRNLQVKRGKTGGKRGGQKQTNTTDNKETLEYRWGWKTEATQTVSNKPECECNSDWGLYVREISINPKTDRFYFEFLWIPAEADAAPCTRVEQTHSSWEAENVFHYTGLYQQSPCCKCKKTNEKCN